jgi:DNA-binding response OmpR family regulator
MKSAPFLIVDDDLVVTTTFERMLRLEGYDVRTASDAMNGLKEAQAQPPCAIILDLQMPIVNGLGFLRELRQLDALRETPVAIVTGDYFLDEDTERELRALGAEIRFKPLWLDDLVDLAKHLSGEAAQSARA